MKKRILIILIALSFLSSGVWALQQKRVIARQKATACDTSNVIFWWRCEAADFSGTNGTLDYSAGDDTGALTNGAAINTDAVKYGTNGLDLPTTFDYVGFSAITATMDDEGRCGFWLRLTTFTDTRRLVYLTLGADDHFIFRLDGTDELELFWRDNSTSRTEFLSVDANLSTGTWYFIEVAYKTSSNYREIFVGGVSKGSSSATIGSFSGAPANVYFGDGTGTAQDTHIDNIIWSTDSTVDLYTKCKDELEWPN